MLYLCISLKWSLAVCMLTIYVLQVSEGIESSLQGSRNTGAVEGSTVYDHSCRIHLLPQIQGCIMGFLQHYRVYQTLRSKKRRTGHLCHSYGESLQCLHLAFLQCPPTNVHLDLMEAELPHPDLMHRLCFTHSKAEDDRVEEATTITDYTGTTHSTQGNSKQPETSSARTASHEGEHLKIILSQKLNEEPSVDTSGGIHVTTSKDMNKLSSGPGQADKVPSRRKFVAHVNRKQTVVVVDSSKENNRPNKSFEYVSEDQRLTQGNHIKQAHLTDSTHSSVQCTDCDITGQARMSTNNTGTQPSCESYLLLLPLFVLLV